jgi:WD40 repeat protein
MNDESPRPATLTTDEIRRVDKLCDRFEAAWNAGRRPRLETYLNRVRPHLRPELLHELLAVELECLSNQGAPADQMEYLRRFPEDTAAVVDAFRAAAGAPAASCPDLLLHWTSAWQVHEAAGDTAQAVPPSPEPFTLVLPCPPSSDPVAPPPPRHETFQVRMLGDFQLLAELGQGGMGVVYRARDRLQRIVALKVIRPDQLDRLTPASRHEWLQRFRREARVCARAAHPHIVAVYDAGEIDGQPYYAMRFVEGSSLATLSSKGPLANRRAAGYLEPVARAVHFIHARGIFHRDLKPSNVLLDENDSPLVTDFGLARWQESPSDEPTTLGVVGTPAYMPPEHGQFPFGTDPAVDVYGLGATLYTLLTGRPPFQAADPVETLRQVREEEPAPPRQLNPAVDRDLELICLKCLRKEPQRRYATAEQLADELQRYLKGEPLRHTRAVGRLERFGRWCRRNPALAGATGLATLTLCACAILSLWFGIYKSNAAADLDAALTKSKNDRAHLAALNEKLAAFAEGQAFSLFDRHEVSLGMLWCGHVLELVAQTPVSDTEKERVIRTNLAAWQWQLSPLRRYFELPSQVLAVAYSPDGKMIATGGMDGKAQLWDATTWEPVGQPLPHRTQVNAIAFSPDGQWLLTASGSPGAVLSSKETGARLWKVATGTPHGDWCRHASNDALQAANILAVALGPDGKTFVTGGEDKTARLWNVPTGKELAAFRHPAPVVAVAFSPDGQTVAAGTSAPSLGGPKSTSGAVYLWNVATKQKIGELVHPEGGILSLAFSPDGALVLTGSADKTARLWETETGKTVWTVQHEGPVNAVAFAPHGQSFLTGSNDRTARLWDAGTGQPIGAPLMHLSSLKALAFRPDGASFVTSSMDKTVRVWETAAGRPPGFLLAQKSRAEKRRVMGVAISPDGKFVATASGKYAGISNTVPERDPNALRAPLSNPSVGPQSGEGEAQLWDASTGKPIGAPLAHSGWVWSVAFSPDSQTLVTGSARKGQGGEARIWDVASRTPVGEPFEHSDWVMATTFGLDGKTILTACLDGRARLWRMSTRRCLASIVHRGLLCVALSPDGKTIVSGSRDHTARLWDAATGAQLGEPLAHHDWVYAVAFSADGGVLLTGSGDVASKLGEARLWDSATGKPIGAPLRHQGAVRAIALSPDGNTLLTGSTDHRAQLWDAATGQALGPPLPIHHNEVRTAAFSPDGKYFLTGSTDGTAGIWETPVPLTGSVDSILLWIQNITGMELDAEHDFRIRVLNPARWEQRARQLEKIRASAVD